VGINSLPALYLETNPSDHIWAACIITGVSNMVKNTILVSGEMRRISSAALTPSITGIFMSRRTISGFNFWTCSTASLPFHASSHTWKKCKCGSRMDRIVVRMTAWSSTISILAGNGAPILKCRQREVGAPAAGSVYWIYWVVCTIGERPETR
jgi:hypothetical protein